MLKKDDRDVRCIDVLQHRVEQKVEHVLSMSHLDWDTCGQALSCEVPCAMQLARFQYANDDPWLYIEHGHAS